MFKFLILIRKFIKKLLETNDRTVMADNFNWLGEENERCNKPFKSELVNKEKKILCLFFFKEIYWQHKLFRLLRYL